MPGLVNAFQQAQYTTPVNGGALDAAVVLSNDNSTRVKHNGHDADATIHVQSSDLASRPAAGVAQRLWFTTDEKRLYLDTGSAWVALTIAAGDVSSGTLAVARGGTGLGSAPGNGQLLIGNGTAFALAALTAGTGISITNGAGTITIANTGATYAEGSFTATGNGVTFVRAGLAYTKIGRVVTVRGLIEWPVTANTSEARIDSLPFTADAMTAAVVVVESGTAAQVVVQSSTAYATLFNASGVALTNADLSGKVVYFTATYFAS